MLDAISTSADAVLFCNGNGDTQIHSGQSYATVSWNDILERVAEPAAKPKANAPAIIPSSYTASDGRSHAAQRERGSFPLLVADVDTGSPTLAQVRDALHAVLGDPLDAVIYSSGSARPEDRKWRLIVRLATPIAGIDYSDTANSFFDLMQEQGVICDRALARTGQLAYLPNTPPERRGPDGRPMFYEFAIEHQVPPEVVDLVGPSSGLDLSTTPVLARREQNRRQREAEAERLRHERAAKIAARPQGEDTVIGRYNARHSIADLLSEYGYEEAGNGQDWRSPYQSSASFATRDFGDHWISLSESDKAAGLGAPSASGGCYGDGFDLFTHYTHKGDRTAAMSAARAEEALAGFDVVEGTTTKTEQSTSGLALVVAASLDGIPVPERRWHVRDLLPAGTVALLSGDGGVGKSLLALQLAAATASGGPWVGQECQTGGALVLAAEDDLDELHRRLAAICAAEMIDLRDLTDLRIAPLAGQNALLAEVKTNRNRVEATELWQELRAQVETHRPALVVLDTLADLFGGDENVRTMAQQFVAQLRSLCVDFGSTVLLLAHPSLTGISTGTGTSGSTAWSNSVRSRLYLKKGSGDLRLLETMKSNYGKTGTVLTLEWANGAFRLVGADDQGAREAAKRADAREAFLEMLARYNAAGVNVSPNMSRSYAPTIFSKDKDGAGIRQEDYATAMLELLGSGEVKSEVVGPPSRRRQRLVVGGT